MALSRKQLCIAMMVSGLMAVAPAVAQVASEPPLTEVGNGLVLATNGHSFRLPLPDWLTPAERLSGNVTPLVETSFVSDANQALLEIYPKGESQAAWQTLYGARITLEASRPLTDYRSAVMYGYSQTCKPELTGFFQFGDDEGDQLAPLGFVCGAYLDRLAGHAGDGEVMVMSFSKTEKGVAIVYQEWRGPVFDPSKPETWPVSPEALQARADQLQAEATLSLAD
ncbi:hypothetical protein ACLI1C_00200 [Devosia sp. XGJD_8]|jgi:hypothetical protein|uniref:hypothetical protein n=1 Tax=Devosia sp. XGJD_8 TaxID=3391187 RepID=UPI00398540F9